MTTPVFIGRQAELLQLKATYDRGVNSLVVIKGRRRIGKSRLATEFATQYASDVRFWSFSGLAPQEGITAQIQRDHFARQLAAYLKIPPLTFQDWSDAFQHLSLHLKKGDILLLDEISWMSTKDPTFIPKLKDWWDKHQTPIMVVLCGSVSTWIEDNILKSTAFFGRITLTLTLEPLSIRESAQFLRAMGFQGSAYEVYKLLSIFGGIPWYLEQIRRGMMADDIIKALCFHKEGLLVTEFDRIFHDLFNGKGIIYKKILNVLQTGMKTLSDIRNEIDFTQSGTLSDLMEHLITAGFVRKQNLWSFKTEKTLKQSLYRICDPYVRFYLKVIEPNRDKIDVGFFDQIPLSSFPGFDANMGLQVECLLLQNREAILQSMGITSSDVACDGPYRQMETSKARGCQIDYLVQTRMKNLFLCEFKFKRRELGIEVLEEMQAKMDALKIPRGFAAVQVLFHIGGVSASVAEERTLYRIIDISDFLHVA